MQDADHRWNHPIENQVFAYGKTSVTLTEFIAAAAGIWILPKHPKCSDQSINKSVSGCRIVFSDMLLDRLNVETASPGKAKCH
jgi:hypothetical protein